MMDFMKTQLMTMMMMKSMNSPQESNSNIFYMIYAFMATALIDFICKTLAPEIITRMNEYYRENKKKLMKIGPISSKKGDPVKTSSITIQIRILAIPKKIIFWDSKHNPSLYRQIHDNIHPLFYIIDIYRINRGYPTPFYMISLIWYHI